MQRRNHTTSILAVLACLMLLTSSRASAGDLTGKFVYDGPIPEAMKLVISKDAEYFGKLGLVNESLTVGENAGIANVVIYVRTKGVEVTPAAAKVPEKVVLDNKGGRFSPHIVPLWLDKQALVLKNSDPVAHNSNIQPLGDTGVNPLIPASAEIDHKFNRAQSIPIPVGCNIHPWMTAYVLPRDNPYATATAADGTFTIKNLPDGAELEFQVWHEMSGYLALADWPRGRFSLTIKPGTTDLGTIKVSPEIFEK